MSAQARMGRGLHRRGQDLCCCAFLLEMLLSGGVRSGECGGIGLRLRSCFLFVIVKSYAVKFGTYSFKALACTR